MNQDEKTATGAAFTQLAETAKATALAMIAFGKVAREALPNEAG